MTETFEEVCANIKACLNSSKNQISMSDLDRKSIVRSLVLNTYYGMFKRDLCSPGDYHSILGTKIPFHALGFRSLESLLRAVPDLKITQIGRDVFIDVKLDEKTMHITNLVRGQKCNKKKPPVGCSMSFHCSFFFGWV